MHFNDDDHDTEAGDLNDHVKVIGGSIAAFIALVFVLGLFLSWAMP